MSIASIEELIVFAGKVANGDIVAKAIGKMEYGPRALGTVRFYVRKIKRVNQTKPAK